MTTEWTHISITGTSLPAESIRRIRLDVFGRYRPSDRVPGVVPLIHEIGGHGCGHGHEGGEDEDGEVEEHPGCVGSATVLCERGLAM